jgi:DNA processing protein
VADGEAAIAAAARLGASVLLPGDAEFPVRLLEIPDPPAVLFAIGRLELLAAPAVAIVGSRDHTAYGADVCRRCATAAAVAGITVVSGMARGLDAVAHEAALAAGGSTAGVLGNGLGVIYPAANRALYERIAIDGVLVTEFPPGERPHAGSFPRRNRLISGLARVTVVVEAAIGSGAIITAGTALDQGRDVMAVPGQITSLVSRGTNLLIRDGAEPLLSPDDLLAHFTELPLARGAPPAAGGARSVTLELPLDLAPELAAIAAPLRGGAAHIDDVAARTGRPIAEVLAALCELEIAGLVEQRAGRMFAMAPRAG